MGRRDADIETADVVDPPPEAGPPEPAGPRSGTFVGRYVLGERLGVGGMGVVYAATDLELGRRVALKLLPQRENEEARARLVREAQALAQVEHPSVVPIYDVGFDGDEVFIAMKLVQGQSLRRWLETARSWREVVAVFVHVARGLAAIHAAGLVHRDVKPENVLVGDDGSVQIVDFGLAKVDLPSAPTPLPASPGAQDLTLTGGLLGTPGYLSPEQNAGERGDAASDQWSFCVALHEALHGERPFGGETRAEREAAFARGPAAGSGRVPSWLRAIVHRGLSVDKTRRYRSMTAVADALARTPEHRRRSAHAAGVSVAPQAVRLRDAPAQRTRWFLSISAALVVAAGTALFVWQPWRSAHPGEIAEPLATPHPPGAQPSETVRGPAPDVALVEESAQWQAKVMHAVGVDLPSGTRCVVTAKLRSRGYGIEVPGLSVLCANKTVFAQNSSTAGAPHELGRVTVRRGAAGANLYELAYKYVGPGRGDAPQMVVSTEAGTGAIWTERSDVAALDASSQSSQDGVPYRIELSIARYSEPAMGVVVAAAAAFRGDATVKEVSGPSPLPVETRCDIYLFPTASAGRCSIQLSCDSVVSFEHQGACTTGARGVITAIDPDPTPVDGDPRFALDAAKGVIVVGDDDGDAPWSATLGLERE